jgi:hypothetical protein
MITKALLVKANIIESQNNVIEETIMDQPFSLGGPDERMSYRKKRYPLETFRTDDCEFKFFVDPDEAEAIKIFLETQIQQAMRKTGYEDMMYFRQIKKDYGEQFSTLLVQKSKDPVVKKQLMRALDF